MSIHDVTVRTIDGRETTLDEFAGEELLIVNVASKCGFTPQYAGLQKLYEKYKDGGFEVLGFPCNRFMFQEPAPEDKTRNSAPSTGPDEWGDLLRVPSHSPENSSGGQRPDG